MEWLNNMLNRRDTLVIEMNARDRQIAELRAKQDAAAEELAAIDRAVSPALTPSAKAAQAL